MQVRSSASSSETSLSIPTDPNAAAATGMRNVGQRDHASSTNSDSNDRPVRPPGFDATVLSLSVLPTPILM